MTPTTTTELTFAASTRLYALAVRHGRLVVRGLYKGHAAGFRVTDTADLAEQRQTLASFKVDAMAVCDDDLGHDQVVSLDQFSRVWLVSNRAKLVAGL